MNGIEFSPRDWDGPPVYRVHVLEAMAATNPSEDHGGRSTFIRFGDQEYPLKYIVREATERAGKRIEGPKTNEMEKLVEKLGFQVIKR
ncbi:MAG: hypothetical protein U5J64_06355 [Halobacteriales archaeon]|nr:hypothetical protein [Halobacteriales archaeon]